MKKLLGILGLAVLCAPVTEAQNITDALRYSTNTFGGTARFESMGGAFGALGGDISTLSYNPAGIGVFRKSEFAFSTGFANINTQTNYLGENNRETEPNLNIPSIGFISTSDASGGSGWRNLQFGVAYNRLNSFHSDYTVSGTTARTSLLDLFAGQATGIAPVDLRDFLPFGGSLAYQTFAINPTDTLGTGYTTAIPFGVDIAQQKDVHTEGRLGETVISFGGNFDDIFYIGGTLGFPRVRYNSESVYSETISDTSVALQSYEFTENLNTVGSGFNAKFGIIARPTDFLRLGVAVHSPTWFSLTDTWNSRMETTFRPATGFDPNYTDNSPEGRFDYRLTTPAKAIGSVAFVLGKYGILSADYEYIDYSTAELRSAPNAGSSASFRQENQDISQALTASSNLRVGGEVRLNPFSIRAGYALYGSPYADDISINDAIRTSYSFGLGYRDNGFYLDLGYVLTQSQEDLFLYDPSLVELTTVETNFSRVNVTLGFRY